MPAWGTHKTVSVGGYRIAYTDTGNGRPVLLLHGYGGEIALWHHQVSALSSRYRVLAPDLLGHGFSDKPRLHYTPQLFVKTVTGFFDSLDLERVTVIGHSMGGAIAMALAMERPGRVDRVVLIDSLTPGFTLRTLVLKTAYSLRHVPLLFKLYLSLPGTLTTRISLSYMLHDKTRMTEEMVATFHAVKRLEGFHHTLVSVSRHLGEWNHFGSLLRGVKQPTLILWGEQDRYLPVEDGYRLKAAIPDSRLIIIPKTGHIPMWEQPEFVNREIASFLDAHSH